MSDYSNETDVIEVAEPGFYDGRHATIERQDSATLTQGEIATRLAELQSKAGVQDQALKQILLALSDSHYSHEMPVIVGEPARPVNLPLEITRGTWALDSIFAFADSAAAANVNVLLTGLFRGFNLNFAAQKLIAGLDGGWARIGKVLNPSSRYEDLQISATGTAGDKALVIFNLNHLRRVR